MKLQLRDKKTSIVREKGSIPGVIYGKGFDSISIQLPYQDFNQAVRKYGFTKTFEVTLEGKKHAVYIREAQVESMNQHQFIHFDLVKVAKGDTLNANVSLHFINKENLPSKLVFTSIMDELPIEYKVGSGVAYIDVDVSELTEDKPLFVKDIVLPKGIKADADPEEMVCSLVQPSTEEVKEETEEDSGETLVVPAEE